jgi:1-acyl-sn-glycerol-3-phosphate acyltransferase
MLVVVTLGALMSPLLILAVLVNNAALLRLAHYVPTRLARVGLLLMGIKLHIINPELIDADGQYIYISNHRSYLDAIIAGAAIPNYLKFLGKAEMLSWPGVGYLLGKYYVPVWRKDKDHRAWSMHEMEEKVKTGCSFFICPEGTCNVGTDFFTRFYDGAFRLSVETGIPLVPLTIIGSGELMPRNKMLIHPGTITLYWHPSITASSFEGDKMEAGKAAVIEQMRIHLLAHYPSGRYES